MTIILPLFRMIVFSYPSPFDLNHIPYAVWKEDSGEYSRQLLAHFSGSTNFQLVGWADVL
ncbi:MAG: hypothetical protein ACYCRD_03575 [Leptospirillum sp.]